VGYLSVSNVAALLDVSEKTVRKLIHAGHLPAIQVGGIYRISQADYDKYLREMRYIPAPRTPGYRPAGLGDQTPKKYVHFPLRNA